MKLSGVSSVVESSDAWWQPLQFPNHSSSYYIVKILICYVIINYYHPYQEFNPRQAISIQALSETVSYTQVCSPYKQQSFTHRKSALDHEALVLHFASSGENLPPLTLRSGAPELRQRGSSCTLVHLFATTAPTTFKWWNTHIKLRILHICGWSSLHLVKVNPPDLIWIAKIV
jgi:hypothetical protein